MQMSLLLNPQRILPCSTDFGTARVGRLCSEFVDDFRDLGIIRIWIRKKVKKSSKPV